MRLKPNNSFYSLFSLPTVRQAAIDHHLSILYNFMMLSFCGSNVVWNTRKERCHLYNNHSNVGTCLGVFLHIIYIDTALLFVFQNPYMVILYAGPGGSGRHLIFCLRSIRPSQIYLRPNLKFLQGEVYYSGIQK